MPRPTWPRWARPSLAKASVSWMPSLPPGATTTDLRNVVQAMQRTSQEFETDADGRPVQFGPGVPPVASPLGGDPRAYQYRTGWNIPSPPGEGKLVSWDTLKTLPRVYEVLGVALRTRINAVATMHFDLVARDRGDSGKARDTLKKQATTIARIKDRMAKPDGRHCFETWLRSLLYARLTLDATTIYIRRNLDPDAGPIDPATGDHKGEVVALEEVDGATIKPLLGPDGRRPLPPAPFAQQYLYGVARESFSTQDLIYAPCHTQVDTPYGFSEVEQMIVHMNMALRYWQSMSAIWTDGTMPEGVAEGPPEWSVQQLREYNDEWDALLAGDVKALRKMHFVPAGFKWHDFKALEFNEAFARYLFDVTCVCVRVTPIEMGMEPSHGGLGGKGLGEVLVDVSERNAVRPDVRWLFDEILNPIIWQEYGATDLEWSAVELDQQQEYDKAQAQNENLRNGRVSLDELIEEDGGAPIGVGRLWEASNGQLYGEPDLIAISTQGALAAGYLGQTPSPTADPAASAAELRSQEPPPELQGQRNTGIGPASEQGAKDATTDAQHGSATQTPADQTAKKIADLRRWETKATKAVRAGKPAAVTFNPDTLPPGAAELIRKGLAHSTELRHVRSLFADARTALGFAELAEVG
jgi:hypothetical protein